VTIPDPMKAIRAAALADADVAAQVAARVYVPELPRGDAGAMPRKCIVLTPSGGPGNGSTAPIGDTRFDAKCYGATALEAAQVYYAFREFARELAQTRAGGALIYAVSIETGPTHTREPEVDWPMVLGVFRVTASELVAA
jgi:hypothetical protein